MKEYINDAINKYLNYSDPSAESSKSPDEEGHNKIPWHMPGHKRKAAPWGNDFHSDAFGHDLTEVPGMDDLHHPEEMIKQSMDEMTKVYKSFKSYYLVNGSTSGNLASVFACLEGMHKGTGKNGKESAKEKAIMIARNCHKSVFNSLILSGVKPVYIYPRVSDEISIDGQIDAEDIRSAIEKNSYLDIKCCIITSPTYEGIISDIEKISECLHEYNIPLIVDEAHGAHFPFYEEEGCGENSDVTVASKNTGCSEKNAANDDGDNTALYPRSALYKGADIVIQSLHKTLPCYTQTAVLHIAENAGVKGFGKEEIAEKVERYLRIFQTSSPSYIFLQAMEKCIAWCDENRNEFIKHFDRIRRFRDKFRESSFRNLRLFGAGDLTRLVIFVKGVTGKKASELLEEKTGVVVEMAGNDYLVFISTVMDSDEDFDRLIESLRILDESVDNESDESGSGSEVIFMVDTSEGSFQIKDAVGRRVTDYIYVYPPGIPIIAPYEIIEEKHVAEILHDIRCGYSVRSGKK